MQRNNTGEHEIPDTIGPEETGQTQLGPLVWVMGALMIVTGVTTGILMLRDFQPDSYIFLAFYSIPANTAISIFPHEPVLIYFGKVADLHLAALWATLGTVAAGIMDHAVFVPVLNLQNIQAYKKKKFYRKAIALFMRWPFATIIVTGFTPIPFFPFKFLVFSIRYPMWKWLTALVVARYPRYYLLALLGKTFGIPNWVLIASVVVIFGLYLVKAAPGAWRRFKSRRAGKSTVQRGS